MPKSNWSVFTKRIPIGANIEQVYNAWTTQAGLESWFLRKAEFTKTDKSKRAALDSIQKGDAYEWYWHGYPDTSSEKRTIVDANGKDQLQFIFSGNCLVTVSIISTSGITICELKQENIPQDDNPNTNLLVGCGEGWTFYLTNLKSILEGGIDLRNKNLALTGVINS